MSLGMTVANSVGCRTTWIPELINCRAFFAAEGSTNDLKAPAWPMIRPGTACCPATSAAIGLEAGQLPYRHVGGRSTNLGLLLFRL